MSPPAPAILENPSTIPSAQPPSTRLSPNREDLDYTKYFKERSPLQDSDFVDPLNPYASNICHGGGDSPTLDEHLFTPCRERSLPSHLSPQLTPLQPLSERGKVPLLSQEVNLISKSVVALSMLQEMDMDTELTLPRSRTNDEEDVQYPPVVDEIAMVEPSPTKRNMINCSDISSCHSQRHLLGKSNDRDSDENDEDFDQGVSFPAVANLQ